MIALGPLHGAPPTKTSALLMLSAGIVGFLWILANVMVGKHRHADWRRLFFFSVVLLFLVITGVMQLLQVLRR